MTARWRSGAEIAPHTADTEFSAAGGVQESTIRRSGASSLKVTGTAYSPSTRGFNLQGMALRTYFHVAGTPTSTQPILGVWGPTQTTLVTVQLRTDRKLELCLGYAASVLATSAVTIPIGSFDQCLEVWLDRTTNIIAIRHNGAEWARATVPPSAFSETFDAVWFGTPSGLGTTIYYDDMAINSLDGPYNNGWPGPSEGGVLTFRPVADAERVNWSLAGAATTYDCLDDLVPDTTASYIVQSGSGLGAAAGVYFPAWPVAIPASAVHLGLSAASSPGTSQVTTAYYDSSNVVTAGTTTLGAWGSSYPVLTVERAWDGTRRRLNNGYLMPSSGARSRVTLIRADNLTHAQYVSTLWMTVDLPLALAAAPVPVGAYHPTILAELVNP